MKQKLTLCIFIIGGWLYGQQPAPTLYENYFSPEILFGKTMPANSGFPESKPQTALFLSFGKYNDNNPQEWAHRLNHPRTGIRLGFSDYGNADKIGYSISVLPYIEFDILRKQKDLHMAVGLGASYFNTGFDSIANPWNRGISTHFTWAFKGFFYYDFLKKTKSTWRVGLGYVHNSNGHTRLPNQGFNSFVLSASAVFDYKKGPAVLDTLKPIFKRNSRNFFSIRSGVGQNVLSEVFNDRKEVYSVAVSYGKVINGTYKFGAGIYYRFYEQYYDYIKNEEKLIVEEYPHFAEKPFSYATNLGLFGSAELLMNHIGFEFQLGINLSKPFYQIDWKLNQGYQWERDLGNGETETVVVLGELDSYYELKRTISSRLALKYYLLATEKNPVHNLFIGAALNANLGQADFTELNLGYVYCFNFKE